MILEILLTAAVIGTGTGQAPKVACKGEATLVFSIAHMREVGVPWERFVQTTNDEKRLDQDSRENLLKMGDEIYHSKVAADDLRNAMFKACMENLPQTRD